MRATVESPGFTVTIEERDPDDTLELDYCDIHHLADLLYAAVIAVGFLPGQAASIINSGQGGD